MQKLGSDILGHYSNNIAIKVIEGEFEMEVDHIFLFLYWFINCKF